MRMNPEQGFSAADLIQKLDEKNLANLIYKYGEEKFSRRIARKIKNEISNKGPFPGTKDLAFAIAGCYPPKLRKNKIHPATKTFQALRIVVNKELEVLETLLQKAPDWLHDDGLLGVISFHSLEDRKVKQSFISDERIERITRKPIRAESNEILDNPRSRSAKFRIGKRIS